MENNQNTIISGFEFLPAIASSDYIEIYPPFAELVKEHFSNRNLELKHLESGSIVISFSDMHLDTKKVLLNDIKIYLKKSRRQLIDNFLIYKNNGISYL